MLENTLDIIKHAIRLYPDGDNFIFACEFTQSSVTHHTLHSDDLKLVHADLPEAARLCSTLGDFLSAKCLRLTLDYWNNQYSDLNLTDSQGNLTYMSTPYRVSDSENNKHVYIVSADTFSVMKSSSSISVVNNINTNKDFYLYKPWFDKHYPGSFEKLSHLIAIGGFSSKELATLAFTNTPVHNTVVLPELLS